LIRAAQKNGRPLTKTEIDKMVDGYKRKMLNLRGQTIARTETLNALRAGQYDGFKSMVETGVVRDDEMTREWLPTSDNRTREDHSAMAGVIVAGMETPFTLPDGSQGMFPGDSSLPPGQTINCFAPWTPIARAGLLTAIRRDYRGDMVELSTGLDVNLTVTPNHPILTGRGWVAAGEIKKGDKLFHCEFGNDRAGWSCPDVEDVQASAEQIYGAAKRLCRQVRRAGLVMDFHGDGTDKDIDIVAVPCRLGDAIETKRRKVLQDFLFAAPDIAHGKRLAFRLNFASMWAFTKLSDGSMRRLCARLAVFRRKHGGAAPVALAQRGFCDAKIGETLVYCRTSNTNSFGDSQYGQPEIIRAVHGFEMFRSLLEPSCEALSHFGTASRSDRQGQAHISQARLDNVAWNSGVARYVGKTVASVKRFLNGTMMLLAGDGPVVKALLVDSVRFFHYDGPVYNFESETNILIAGGIVNHNCRCAVIARIRLPERAK